jgi:hypothetical protein
VELSRGSVEFVRQAARVGVYESRSSYDGGNGVWVVTSYRLVDR